MTKTTNSQQSKTSKAPRNSTKKEDPAIINSDVDESLPFTPAEEIPHEQPKETGLAVMTAEQMAQKEIARFDKPRAWIAEKKAAYKDLTITGVDDKEGYKTVKKAWQEVRNKRLAVANKHKEIKGDYLVITRAVDKEKNELTELLEEVELPLKEAMDRIDAIELEQKQNALKEAEQKLHNRVTELLSNGMKYDGSYYAMGDNISMDVVTLKTMDDEAFGRLLKTVTDRNQELIEAENKRIADEEAERKRVEDQKLENERKEKELAEERLSMKKEKHESRAEHILNLGYSLFENGWWKFSEGKKEDSFQATDTAFADFDAQEWADFLQKRREEVTRLKQQNALEAEEERLAKEKEDKEKAEKLEFERKVKLRESQLDGRFQILPVSERRLARKPIYENCPLISVQRELLENSTEEEWEEFLEVLKMEHDEVLEKESMEAIAIERDKELKRKAALSDTEKVNEWLRGIAEHMANKPELVDFEINNLVVLFDTGVSVHMEDLIDKLAYVAIK